MWKTHGVKKETQTHLWFFAWGKDAAELRSGKFVADAVDLVLEGAVARHLAFDHVDGGKDGCMVSSEDLCGILQGKVRYVADHVDGDMTCKCDLGGSLLVKMSVGDLESGCDKSERESVIGDHLKVSGACLVVNRGIKHNVAGNALEDSGDDNKKRTSYNRCGHE